MSFAFRSLITVAAVCALATPVSAQSAISHAPATAERITIVDVRATPVPGKPEPASIPLFASAMANTAFDIPAAPTAFSAVPAAPVQPSTRNAAMMIVGGVGLLVGSVVGGDEGTVIMIGSGGLGLLGLWRYLQ